MDSSRVANPPYPHTQPTHLPTAPTQTKVHNVLTTAFASPFDHLTEMVRLTFVVGGGKGVRARYDDSMPKWCR